MKKEVMNIEKSLNRLNWRFKNPQVKIGESKIIINQLDVDAIDFLVKWVNNQKKETLNENELFAKMFVYCLAYEIEFYKDVSFASQKLQQELSKPLSSNYDKILDTLNRVEMNKYLQSIGIITDHIENMLLTQKKEDEQIELKKKYAPEIKKYLFGIWSKESVYKSLNNTITECINKYKK
jgi:phage host-nuclease inhibitor protein Gam